MTGAKINDSAYVAIHLSRILRSEKLLMSVTEVLQEDYLNPFSPLLDAQQLYNISLGVPVEGSSQVLQLLNMRQTRTELRNCFIQTRLVSGVASFHSLIIRNNLKPFTSTGRTIKVKIGRETSIFEVNRNIMAKIISRSVKYGKAVVFKEALRYPLCPVPSIAFPGGIK